MTDASHGRPFDNAGSTGHEPDEETVRQKWQQPAPNEARLRTAQARRLIGRRPLLKGLAVGVGLLALSGAELEVATREAYAQHTTTTTRSHTTAGHATTTTTQAH